MTNSIARLCARNCRCLSKLPFGEELFAGIGGRTTAQGYQPDNIRQQFTGYERDGETGLDFAQARYYASVQGRFTSPDLLSGTPARPQSWNRYSYVLNNPLRFIDPTGMRWAQKTLRDGSTRYKWFDTEEEYNTALRGGYSQATFNETEPFRYSYRNRGPGNLINTYQLNPDGTHECVNCGGVTPAFGDQVAMTGVLQGLFRGLAGLFGRSGATAAGAELSGLYGRVSAETVASIERAAASEARVEVFARLTQAPALGRSLHIALDEAGAAAARTTGQIYRAQIPQPLLDQLVRSGLATRGNLVWEGGRRVSVQYDILPQASRFVVDYFK